jgi:signal transduction histidine kinase
MTCLLAPMSIPGISRDILNLFQAKAENLEVTLREEMPSGLPLVMGDADKLRHVVVNLVHNALKYTPAGGTVTIAAAREGEHVWLSVSDTGTGIDAEDISKLFKLFSKGRNSDRTQDGSQGTGLGLYIVKSIIEKHGGEVRVRSEPRAGTTIGFSLKITAIKQEGAAREAPHSGQGGLS